jgi:hypothetical protein
MRGWSIDAAILHPKIFYIIISLNTVNIFGIISDFISSRVIVASSAKKIDFLEID